MRLVLYRCATMRAELRIGRKRASTRTAEPRCIRGRRSLLRLGLSLLSDEILRHRLLRRSGDSAIRGCRIPLRVLTDANDNEATNARWKQNCNYMDNDEWVARG